MSLTYLIRASLACNTPRKGIYHIRLRICCCSEISDSDYDKYGTNGHQFSAWFAHQGVAYRFPHNTMDLLHVLHVSISKGREILIRWEGLPSVPYISHNPAQCYLYFQRFQHVSATLSLSSCCALNM